MNLDAFITLVFAIITVVCTVVRLYDGGTVLKYQKQVVE